MRVSIGVVALLATLGTISETQATYSIVGAQPSKGLLGSAGASCVPYEVIRIYRARSGRGAFVAQAYFDDAAVLRADAMLAMGEAPEAVLASVTDEISYPNAPRMQYGIVDVEGRAVAYTGPLALPTATHRVIERAGDIFTLQGNVLTSDRLLDQMGEGLERPACDLAESLMNALEHASLHGEGDNRCTPNGVPAKSAYLDVTGAELSVRLSIPDVSPNDPIVALRDAFDAWRTDHPCPASNASTASSSGGDTEPPTASTASGCTLVPPFEATEMRGAGSVMVFLLAFGLRRHRKKREASAFRLCETGA